MEGLSLLWRMVMLPQSNSTLKPIQKHLCHKGQRRFKYISKSSIQRNWNKRQNSNHIMIYIDLSCLRNYHFEEMMHVWENWIWVFSAINFVDFRKHSYYYEYYSCSNLLIDCKNCKNWQSYSCLKIVRINGTPCSLLMPSSAQLYLSCFFH